MIRFTKAKAVRKAKPQIGGGKKNTLHKLYSFLNTAEPEAIQFLVSFWNTQARGVTYAELREAYLAGEITPQLYQRWTEDSLPRFGIRLCGRELLRSARSIPILFMNRP